MNPRALVFAVVSLLGLGLAAWAVFANNEVAPQLNDASAAVPTAPAATEAASVTAPIEGAAAAPKTAEERTAAAVPAHDPISPTATIRGRCVDAQRQPLAGCTVQLRGAGERERLGQWLRDHPTPVWQNPEPLTTGADGRFTFTFTPPPPFVFFVDLVRDDLAAMRGRWNTIATGDAIDLGDVTMQPGVLVQGRVVDEAGTPVAKVRIMVRPTAALSGPDKVGQVTPSTATQGRSGADGSFRCAHRLAPGPFLVVVTSDHQLAKPITGSLALERPIEELTVVVKNTADVPTISGRVVDESGQPIDRAHVEARGNPIGWWTGYSEQDGTFTLKARDKANGGDVTLAVQHEQFEATKLAKPIAWGSKDVVLTMVRGGGLTVHVHDDRNAVLTDFLVRVVRDPKRAGSEAGKIRARGPFEAGFARVPGVARGKWTVVVEFPSQLAMAPVFTPIEVTTTTATTRVDVRAAANAQRTLRVVDGADQPVAGTVVQVCLPLDGKLTEESAMLAMDSWFNMSSNDRALVLNEAPTAADGTLLLTGPRGRAVGVSVSGPGHVPVRVGDVRVDDPAELLVRVSRGARLHGRVGPPEAVAEMRRLGGIGSRNISGRRTSIGLVQGGKGQPWVRLPAGRADNRFAVGDDGSFDIDGLPPGKWQVAIHYWSSSSGRQAPAGEVVLRDGETMQFDPDVRQLLPGTLTGVVRKNGAPLANTPIHLQGEPDAISITTDGNGAFTTPIAPGSYHLVIPSQQVNEWTQWATAETATVVLGQTTEQTFDLWTGQLTMTVRDANGAAVPGVNVLVSTEPPARGIPQLKTDAQGTCTKELLAQTLTFRVLPKSLQSLEAQEQLRQKALAARTTDPFAGRLFVLGTATVVANQTTSVELRLPAEWDK
jgi:hypothetical protein